MIKDWIPNNLDEAKKKFDEMYNDGSMVGSNTAKCMYGILYCRVKQGEDFISAYKNTLYDYLKVPKEERK